MQTPDTQYLSKKLCRRTVNFKIRSFVNNKKAQLREIYIPVTSDSPAHFPKSDAQETIVEEDSTQTSKKQISFRGIMSLLKNTTPLMSLK
ncbi:MAG: hypothetical protein CMQ42_00255 [Gammaproteobacteria bacterium]|nr:hypothetical protein [Gammaproteobacteria bacterium]